MIITEVFASNGSFRSIRSKRKSRQQVRKIHLQALHDLENKKVPLLLWGLKLREKKKRINEMWKYIYL